MGFDPEGYLCAAIKCKRSPWETDTAMFAAAAARKLRLCRIISEHGVASTICTKNSGTCMPLAVEVTSTLPSSSLKLVLLMKS